MLYTHHSHRSDEAGDKAAQEELGDERVKDIRKLMIATPAPLKPLFKLTIKILKAALVVKCLC